MAIIFVDSAGGSNTSPYETEGKAATAMQTAITAWSDGDEIHVLDTHNEGTATVAWTLASSTNANRIPIYRISTGGAYSPTSGSDTKQYDASTAGADITFSLHGSFHGEYFFADDNILIGTVAGRSLSFTDCKMEVNTNNSQIQIGTGNSDSAVEFNDHTFQLNHASGADIWMQGHVDYNGGVVTGTANSNGLFRASTANRTLHAVIRGVDFSGMSQAASVPLVDISVGSDINQEWNFIACDVQASQVYHDGGFINDHQFVYVHNTTNTTDDGDTFTTARYSFRGDVETDTGVYYGGTDAYQDYDGTTSLSHKMTPADNVDIASPLVSLDMYAIVESTGTKTFTVECVEAYTAALTKRECWLEVFYLGSGTESLWSVASDREIVGSSYTTFTDTADDANWTGEPASPHTIQVQASSVTVNQAGAYMVRLHLAKHEPGKSLYYNPKVTIT